MSERRKRDICRAVPQTCQIREDAENQHPPNFFIKVAKNLRGPLPAESRRRGVSSTEGEGSVKKKVLGRSFWGGALARLYAGQGRVKKGKGEEALNLIESGTNSTPAGNSPSLGEGDPCTRRCREEFLEDIYRKGSAGKSQPRKGNRKRTGRTGQAFLLFFAPGTLGHWRRKQHLVNK